MVIWITIGPEELKSKAEKFQDGLQLASILAYTGHEAMNKRGEAIYKYTCKALKDGACLIRKTRPRMCRGFPFYWTRSNYKKDRPSYVDGCGYNYGR